MPITHFQKAILDLVEELKPYETITIRKDANGVIKKIIVQREQTLILTESKLTVMPNSNIL